MTWRPILTIFDLFSKINRSDKAPIQARMAVLLACPSLSGKSKHRSCQRALLATFPQESVSAAHVFSEQKKLWARCFKNCLSSESKMLIVGAFSDEMARASCWEWLLRSSSGRLLWNRASASRLVSLWRILFEVPTTDWCGVERAWRFPFFWMWLLYFLT